jgi:hypothetical protein
MRNLLVFLIFVIALFAAACSDDDTPAPDAGTDAVVVEAGTDAVAEASAEAGPQEAGPVEAGPVEGGPVEGGTLEASVEDGAAGD